MKRVLLSDLEVEIPFHLRLLVLSLTKMGFAKGLDNYGYIRDDGRLYVRVISDEDKLKEKGLNPITSAISDVTLSFNEKRWRFKPTILN